MPSLNLPWLLLAATTLPEVRAWTTLSQAWHGAQIGSIQIQTGPNNATDPNRAGHIANMLNYIWHEPPDISSTQGLGSGLSWAFDPEICSSSKSDLLGRFDESLFGVGLVTCESLKAAMHRALPAGANSHGSTFRRHGQVRGVARRGKRGRGYSDDVQSVSPRGDGDVDDCAPAPRRPITRWCP